jgi:inosine-uridine nucleoside N-ribohydrolase
MYLRRFLSLGFCLSIVCSAAVAQIHSGEREKVIIDTDIGDDIDDAFAVALALKSPEFDILGFSTAFGDTKLRADLLDRLLAETGYGNIPVAVGRPTQGKTTFTQLIYAKGGTAAHKDHPDSVDFMLKAIREHPHEVTLIAIAPLVNIGAMIEKDPATFRLLKRVVMMGGSIGGFSSEFSPVRTPQRAEWNIVNDIPSAQKLFNSGVPIAMMPLDSTIMRLDEDKRAVIFRQATPLTNALTALYYEWGAQTPTLFDPMTMVYLLKPEICPVVPMHIRVDDQGFTRKEDGPPNAMVCLHSDQDEFFHLYIDRLVARAPSESRP